MPIYLKASDKVKHIPTNSIVEVIEILPKVIFSAQQVKCKCLKSSIKEDIGQVFEYDLDNLEKL